MNMHRTAWISAVLLAGATGFGLHALAVRPPEAAAEPPRVVGAGLDVLTGREVVLVLRDDWANRRRGDGVLPGSGTPLLQANCTLVCRIDEVHADWVEVSVPRAAPGNGSSAREFWVIRRDAIFAIQTGEAAR